jgi:hypothetical protein
VPGVVSEVYSNGWPQDPATAFAGAATIVIYSDGGEGHPFLRDSRLKTVGALMKKGVGLVVFHYANQIANETARQYFLDWLGAYWKEGVSTNPMDEWSMTVAPQAESHPILRGVKPWTYREEIFCRFFLPENAARTPLLIGTPAKNTAVGPQVASFAYQRKEGGRGFVMGGLDFNGNMLIEDNRRFLLNGIVWAAGMEVPAGGVASSSIPEDMVVVSPPRPARPPQ